MATNIILSLTIGLTAFLCLLNGAFAFVFRKRRISEELSYLAAGLIELLIFGIVIALRLGIFRHIPYHLPPTLPFNRSEIGAAIALGLGLLPAAYWHRTSVAQIRKRMAQDAKAMKQQDSGVRIRGNAPGEWMN